MKSNVCTECVAPAKIKNLCRYHYVKAWHVSNPNKAREYHRKAYRLPGAREKKQAYQARNKEAIRARSQIYHKDYYRKNCERIKKRTNADHVRRYRNDANFRLRICLGVRLKAALKGKNKSVRTLNMIGCSILELRAHLENKFSEGMSWSNHTRHGWHVDHIRPLCSFDLSDVEQVKIAMHYTNLQPLWARDNIRKGGKF